MDNIFEKNSLTLILLKIFDIYLCHYFATNNKIAITHLWHAIEPQTMYHLIANDKVAERGHGGRVVTPSPPTSEAGVRSPSRPYVGKLVVACRWSAVYSTQP